jgi:hypothetical protein
MGDMVNQMLRHSEGRFEAAVRQAEAADPARRSQTPQGGHA